MVDNFKDIQTVEQFDQILEEIYTKANTVVEEKYNNQEKCFACGFAWTKIDVDGRSKIGRIVKKSKEFRKAWDYGYNNWTRGNGFARKTQSIDVKETWQGVIASELTKLGFKAYMQSRMD